MPHEGQCVVPQFLHPSSAFWDPGTRKTEMSSCYDPCPAPTRSYRRSVKILLSRVGGEPTCAFSLIRWEPRLADSCPTMLTDTDKHRAHDIGWHTGAISKTHHPETDSPETSHFRASRMAQRVTALTTPRYKPASLHLVPRPHIKWGGKN